MDEPHEPLNRAGRQAIDKHQRLLHHKTLELLLGSMVAAEGIHAVREKLMWYYEHLAEFDNDPNKIF